jgi:glycogen operon protein
MNEGDWNDPGASVLGMLLNSQGEKMLVWFNRRTESVPAQLPTGEWQVALESDDTAEVPLENGKLVLPPRSVVALVPASEDLGKAGQGATEASQPPVELIPVPAEAPDSTDQPEPSVEDIGGG